MAKYVILIHGNEELWGAADQAAAEQLLKDHTVFQETVGAAVIGGEGLQPTSTATSVRRDSDGGFVVTDGAFAEAKEALGGFYLVEVANLDEAIAIAKQVPAPFGGVEIRPVMVFE